MTTAAVVTLVRFHNESEGVWSDEDDAEIERLLLTTQQGGTDASTELDYWAKEDVKNKATCWALKVMRRKSGIKDDNLQRCGTCTHQHQCLCVQVEFAGGADPGPFNTGMKEVRWVLGKRV